MVTKGSASCSKCTPGNSKPGSIGLNSDRPPEPSMHFRFWPSDISAIFQRWCQAEMVALGHAALGCSHLCVNDLGRAGKRHFGACGFRQFMCVHKCRFICASLSLAKSCIRAHTSLPLSLFLVCVCERERRREGGGEM